mmetsp:Transcript_88947/g.157497  ORF Transcript_88947/g.157497 Transcript_88947/m.157497 type:complete len:110 (-) Transcript_88947:361-690(-)|eukprot:CAMPEP_0197650852 /NCGR_PEP_ID=MMETSP1338-20131121/31195_1 /TAXON_ID=43686 ORGANISM="Pelagodinium beii, Strain RCC1491" /NCGR_SAMPLE_ID=MMETSP1338 /ASSEMBLY_ACC=CAM_ASM_000754 /LENGTH=109 /DNA_ID=CAMNT_0043225343 /DNA_START=92 /DNA_END=421 /DNA_ORIENTATION=+
MAMEALSRKKPQAETSSRPSTAAELAELKELKELSLASLCNRSMSASLTPGQRRRRNVYDSGGPRSPAWHQRDISPLRRSRRASSKKGGRFVGLALPCLIKELLPENED